jgi:hypothetical protein
MEKVDLESILLKLGKKNLTMGSTLISPSLRNKEAG